ICVHARPRLFPSRRPVRALAPGATAIVPAGEPLLDRHRRDDVAWVTFGPGGDVADLGDVEIPFDSAHMRRNALAALAAARAIGRSEEHTSELQSRENLVCR